MWSLKPQVSGHTTVFFSAHKPLIGADQRPAEPVAELQPIAAPTAIATIAVIHVVGACPSLTTTGSGLLHEPTYAAPVHFLHRQHLLGIMAGNMVSLASWTTGLPSYDRANVGALLKDGANAPCCSPALWGLLGRYYAAVGQLESAKEAVLKQVS
jgi:hypothetical protein